MEIKCHRKSKELETHPYSSKVMINDKTGGFSERRKTKTRHQKTNEEDREEGDEKEEKKLITIRR